MTGADRPQLGWKQPPEWDRFLEAVEDEWGATEPYAGFTLDTAWREYRDDHPLEEYADRLLGATGRRDEPTREKSQLTRDATSAVDGRVWTRVLRETKDEMAAFATESNVPNHEVLRAVVNWYLSGGLLGRLTEKFERAVPEAEDALADLDPEAEEGLTKSERVEIAIAQRLGKQFSEADLARAIEEETSGSDYYHERYGPAVVERKDVKRWEGSDGPDTFLKPESWRAKMTTEIIKNLGGDFETAPPAFTRTEFATAASEAGVEVAKENRDKVNEYKQQVLDRTGHEWDDETGRWVPAEDSAGDDDSDNVEEEMDALMNATAAADGGGSR